MQPIQIVRIEEKCKNCMLCVKACNYGVWQGIDGEPAVVNPGACFGCSHCLSVCPNGAVVHHGLDANQIKKVKKNLLDPDVYREIVMGRRSIRHFKDTAVPDQTIEKILDLASYSPTASSRQDVQYTIIKDKALMGEMSKKILPLFKFLIGKTMSAMVDKMTESNEFGKYSKSKKYFNEQVNHGRNVLLYNAPVLVMIHAPKRPFFANENCNIAATNIMNYAHALGLGTCYIGFLVKGFAFSRRLRRRVALPPRHKVFACMVMGYPAFNYAHTVSRRKNLPKWIH